MIEINTQREDDLITISVAGDVDASSSIQLDNVINEALRSNKTILVNLHELKYISSAGLGVFVSHLEEIQEKKITMILYGLSPSVHQVFSLLGLQDLLTIVATKEEAAHRIL